MKMKMDDDLHEIEGFEGFFKFKPCKILYKFTTNSNFIYCKDFETDEIIAEKFLKEGSGK